MHCLLFAQPWTLEWMNLVDQDEGAQAYDFGGMSLLQRRQPVVDAVQVDNRVDSSRTGAAVDQHKPSAVVAIDRLDRIGQRAVLEDQLAAHPTQLPRRIHSTDCGRLSATIGDLLVDAQ